MQASKQVRQIAKWSGHLVKWPRHQVNNIYTPKVKKIWIQEKVEFENIIQNEAARIVATTLQVQESLRFEEVECLVSFTADKMLTLSSTCIWYSLFVHVLQQQQFKKHFFVSRERIFKLIWCSCMRKSVDCFACYDIVWFYSGGVLSSSFEFRSSSCVCSSSFTLWSSLLICDVVRFGLRLLMVPFLLGDLVIQAILRFRSFWISSVPDSREW